MVGDRIAAGGSLDQAFLGDRFDQAAVLLGRADHFPRTRISELERRRRMRRERFNRTFLEIRDTFMLVTSKHPVTVHRPRLKARQRLRRDFHTHHHRPRSMLPGMAARPRAQGP